MTAEELAVWLHDKFQEAVDADLHTGIMPWSELSNRQQKWHIEVCRLLLEKLNKQTSLWELHS